MDKTSHLTSTQELRTALSVTEEWPKSRIYEIRSLIRNFRGMSNKLVHMVQDSEHNNLLLKEQTNRLQQSEKKLHSL